MISVLLNLEGKKKNTELKIQKEIQQFVLSIHMLMLMFL